MLELEIRLVDGDELNFGEFFLQFNVKTNYMGRVTLKEHSRFDWK